MLKIEAAISKDGKGVDSRIEARGYGDEILNESYAVIKGVIQNIKEADEDMYRDFMTALSETEDWMCADDGRRN